MKKIAIYAAAAAIAAMLALFSYIHQQGGSLRDVLVSMSPLQKKAMEKEIRETLRLYNKIYASFYVTGGGLEGLNEFPASNMIKRRVFQDINDLKAKGLILMHDLDRLSVMDVVFHGGGRAVALTEENWVLGYRDADTMKLRGAVMANPVKVRYYLEYGDNRWMVEHYEIYSMGETPPPPRPWRGL